MLRPPPISTLFPYTTLFRSAGAEASREIPLESDRRQYRRDQGGQARPPALADRARQQLVLVPGRADPDHGRSEEHTSELQSLRHLVCRLLLEKKKVPTIEHI